jgi:hypothetical protein
LKNGFLFLFIDSSFNDSFIHLFSQSFLDSGSAAGYFPVAFVSVLVARAFPFSFSFSFSFSLGGWRWLFLPTPLKGGEKN